MNRHFYLSKKLQITKNYVFLLIYKELRISKKHRL